MLIFTGRFQPFHNGHLYLLEQLRCMYPYETICLAIVKDFSVSIKTEFDTLADSALSKDRFIFNAEDTMRLIQKIINTHQYENATLMPRASDESWHIIDSMFDSNRTWIFTKSINGVDDWENAKIEYYRSKGERTILVPVSKDLSGTDIRLILKKMNLCEISRKIPLEIIDDIMNILNGQSSQ